MDGGVRDDSNRNRSSIVKIAAWKRPRGTEEDREAAARLLGSIGINRALEREGRERREGGRGGRDFWRFNSEPRVSIVAHDSRGISHSIPPGIAAGHVRYPGKSGTPRRPLVTELIRRIGGGAMQLQLIRDAVPHVVIIAETILELYHRETVVSVEIVFDSDWFILDINFRLLGLITYLTKYIFSFLGKIYVYIYILHIKNFIIDLHV